MPAPTSQDRLIGIIERLLLDRITMERQHNTGLAARVDEIEARLAAMEAQWPQIQGENHAPN